MDMKGADLALILIFMLKGAAAAEIFILCILLLNVGIKCIGNLNLEDKVF